MYHDRLYHYANNHHVNANTNSGCNKLNKLDYIVHLSPEALRLHKEDLEKENKL
jgi:hypothetical protein